MFWWVPVLTAALRYLLHLSAEIRPPGSLLQQKEKENEMVNRKGSMISTSKGSNQSGRLSDCVSFII
jgi:hypothetical protein